MRVVLLGATAESTGTVSDFIARAGFEDSAPPIETLTVVASTLTDATVHGLRFSPDIDALTMPATEPVAGGAVDELLAYRVDAEWFPMTERTLAAAVLRTRLLNLGYTLAQATAAMAKRFSPDFDILPLSNQAVEAFAIVDSTAWPIHRWLAEGRPAAEEFVLSGLDAAQAAPGVLAAIRAADLVLVCTEAMPEFGVEAVVSLPGMKDALEGTRGHVVALAGDRLGDGDRRDEGDHLGDDDHPDHASRHGDHRDRLRQHLRSVTFVDSVAEAVALGEIDRRTSTIWDHA